VALDTDYIGDLFAAFGQVTVRRMFGGLGIFADGLMIALVADDLVYLKVDEDLTAEFEREGMGPFSYATKNGRHTILSFWRMPERLYDDPDELARWAKRSLEAARRGAPRRRRAGRAAR
jgi:DNA transformation protein and related proteins